MAYYIKIIASPKGKSNDFFSKCAYFYKDYITMVKYEDNAANYH